MQYNAAVMKNTGGLVAILFVMLLAVMIGCGGSGGGGGGREGETSSTNGTTNGTTGSDPNPFQGSWVGHFECVPEINGHGPFTFTVNSQGAWSASGRNAKTHKDVGGQGVITEDGEVSGTATIGTTQATVTGEFTLGSSTIAGWLIVTYNGGSDQLNVTLQRQ